jgi:hypothetical protein
LSPCFAPDSTESHFERAKETLINPDFRHPARSAVLSFAQAGVHVDIDFIGRKSRWIPALAGMTSKIRVSLKSSANARESTRKRKGADALVAFYLRFFAFICGRFGSSSLS